MPTEIPIKEKTAVVWADTTDYSSTISGLARTAQIDLTSLANAAARQGAKVDLTVLRAQEYLVFVALEFAVAPASTNQINIYFSQSSSATAGNANEGGASGADAAYTGTAGDSLDDSLKAVKLGPFPFIVTSDATTTVQYQLVGKISTPMRYLSVIVDNNSGQALVADAVEMFIALIPLIPESQ